MSSILSFASTFLNKISNLETHSVIEVKIEDYVHYDIMAREDSLILHTYIVNQKVHYEIVLHKENQSRSAFSIYRSSNCEESQIYYLSLKDRLPALITKFPNSINVLTLQELCRYMSNNTSQNLAHICAYFGYVDYYKQLSNESESLSELINAQDDYGKTPLHIAIESQRLNVIQAILSLSNLLKFDKVDESGNNVLHFAAQTNGQILSTLLNAIKNSSNNADSSGLIKMINTKNLNKFTPLYLSCFFDKPTCVKELLKNGADVNGASISNYNGIFQDETCDLNDDRLINMLNVNDMKNGGTPLHWCKSAEVIEILVEKNCDLNAKNFHKDTALHTMVARGDLNCTISLLGHGADVNSRGANGNTPLHVAIKASSIVLVQALIVFGADVDILNYDNDSPRHLAATSTASTDKDNILYVLNSVCARRCATNKPNCTEGCAPEYFYNGIPPEDNFVRNVPFFNKVLLEKIVKNKIVEKFSIEGVNRNNKKKVKLLSLDGGGIRGLILIQILCYLEFITNKQVINLFDWIAGTSTGGILALLLSSGYSARECRNIYFLLKDKLFIRYRPYCSHTLEKFLQKYLGSEKKMKELPATPKLMITTTLADHFPPSVCFFRNYPIPLQSNQFGIDTTEEYLWKVARATGAAPTYFSQFGPYLDGGLVSNNPTLDLLSEVQFYNHTNEIERDTLDIDLLVSLGTGVMPKKPIDKINFSSLFSLPGLSNFVTNLSNLIKVLVEQASQTNGCVVDRAQAWCSMINVPFFRISPPISEDIQMDESDNVKLINMLWETMAYIYMNNDDMNSLMSLLDE